MFSLSVDMNLIRYLGTISLYDFNGFLVLSIRNVDLVILTCVYLN